MTTLLTQTGFADLCGISPQAVHSAIKRERVVAFQKKIDPEHPTNRHFREQSRNRQRRAETAAPLQVGPKSAQDAPGAPKKRNGLAKHVRRQMELDEIDGSKVTGADRNQLDAEKAHEQIQALRIKNEKERGELIPRDLVKQVLNEVVAVETSELLVLGEKLAPEIASIFGVDDPPLVMEASKRVNLEVSKSLEHIERLIDKFLTSFQAGAR